MEYLLEGTKLNKVFKEKNIETCAVCDVDFYLSEGEILGIVGESGSGKSTLIKLIAKRLDPTSGALSHRGVDYTKESLRETGKFLQMIFQDAKSSFDPRKSMRFSIMEAGRGKKDEKELIDIIHSVGLDEKLLDRRASELSGGQCQRMAIARAIYSGAGILLCDEITSALDVTIQSQVVELLKRIKKERSLSIIFVSHDIALVSMICNRIMIMKEGHLVEEGETAEVLCSPKSDYTRSLIQNAIIMNGVYG